MCFEIAISNKICKFLWSYRSPNQPCYEFKNCVIILDLALEALILKRAFLTIILRESNAKQQMGKWRQSNFC